MIPKKIHYCWFGQSEKPKLAQRCLDSWKKFCPDYEIIEWNEDNFDLNYNGYTRYCYDQKKWAFLSDYVRLVVVAEYGGIYFDTDVELLKKPDELLQYEAFYGFENENNISTGLGFGAVPNHETVIAMKQVFDNLYPDKDGHYDLVACPALNTEALVPYGVVLNGKRQNIIGAEILPTEYFNPYDDPTGKLKKTNRTISVHWYSKSWMPISAKLRSKVTKPFHRLFGINCFDWLKRIMK